MKKHDPFRQGVYKPVNRHKFVGNKNPRYLSSWELKFFRWCDHNNNVVKWGSESIVIPYKSPLDGRIHRYMVDNIVHIKEGDKLEKYLIEIKPKRQTKPPVEHGNKKPTTILYEKQQYAVNMSKWESAKGWCKKYGYKFLILTEEQLFPRKFNK